MVDKTQIIELLEVLKIQKKIGKDISSDNIPLHNLWEKVNEKKKKRTKKKQNLNKQDACIALRFLSCISLC